MKASNIVLICLSLLSLALVGCAVPAEQAQVTTPTESSSTTLVCPDCNCPAYEPAEKCTDPGEEPVELGFTNLKLLQKAATNKDSSSYKIESDDYERLDMVRLTFTPRCSSTENELIVEIDNEELYKKIPECGESTTILIDRSDVDDGWDSVTFRTFPEEEYRITDITFTLIFDDETKDVRELDSVEFEERGDDEKQITSFSNFDLVSYKEFEIDLDDDEADRDLTLEFKGESRDGRLILLVNDENVYSGSIEKRTNTIVIPSKHLEEGENYITFIGIPE